MHYSSCLHHLSLRNDTGTEYFSLLQKMANGKIEAKAAKAKHSAESYGFEPKICFASYLGIDLQVQLPHSRNNGLFALIIKMDSKSGIFPCKAVQAL